MEPEIGGVEMSLHFQRISGSILVIGGAQLASCKSWTLPVVNSSFSRISVDALFPHAFKNALSYETLEMICLVIGILQFQFKHFLSQRYIYTYQDILRTIFRMPFQRKTKESNLIP